jgi:hypothetical protein
LLSLAMAAPLPDRLVFEIRVEHAKARVKGMTTSAPSYTKAEYTGEYEWFTREPWLKLPWTPSTCRPGSCGCVS